MASDNEAETWKQVESPGVKVNPEDASKEDVQAGSSKLGFAFFHAGRESRQKKSRTRFENADEGFAVYTSGFGYDRWL